MLFGFATVLSLLWALCNAACSCPSGSYLARPGYGHTISDAYYIAGSETQCQSHNSEMCKQRCEGWLESNGVDCVAFTFDDDTGKCRLYKKQEPIESCGTTWAKRFVCNVGCVLKAPEQNEGYCWGDPHCTCFNAVYEHQQGFVIAPHRNQEQTYYLFKNCDPSDYDDLPFALSGRFAPWSGNAERTANIIDRVWLELYESKDKVYMMQFSSIGSELKYNPNPYDKPTRCTYPNTFPIGCELKFGETEDGRDKFIVKTSGSTTSFTVTLTINVGLEGSSCTWEFRMQYGGQGGMQNARWHKIWVEQPTCWKCAVCGLFGDLQTTPGEKSMLACGGSKRVAYPNSVNWAPSAHGEAWNNDWTWSTKNVESNCAQSGGVSARSIGNKLIPSDRDITDCPNDDIKYQVIDACQSQAIKQKECCDIIEEDECSSLVTGCIADICSVYKFPFGGNTAMNGLVKAMQNSIGTSCKDVTKRNKFAGLVPNLLYKFNDGLLESESFGSQQFDLTNNGLVLKDGLLQCGAQAGSASVSLPSDLKYLSIEASVRVDDVVSSGCIFSVFGVNVYYNDDNTLTVAETNIGDIGNKVIHIVISMDQVSDTIILFIDGDEKANFDATIDNTASTLSLCECDSFKGEILQIAAFYKELGENEAKQLYETRMPEVCKDGALEYESAGFYFSPGDEIEQGQCITSSGKNYAILMKFDGSVVLKDENTEVELEAANANAAYLSYGADGSFSVYAADGTQESVIINANNNAGFLLISDDGEMIAYSGDEPGQVYYPSEQTQGQTSNVAPIVPLVGDEPQPNNDEYYNNYEPQEWNEPEYIKPAEYEPEIAATTTTTASTTSVFVYLLYITVVLLAVNVLCGMVNCWNNIKNKQINRYKVVSIDSSDAENTDIEIESLK